LYRFAQRTHRVAIIASIGAIAVGSLVVLARPYPRDLGEVAKTRCPTVPGPRAPIRGFEPWDVFGAGEPDAGGVG
jgi:hypothetical protein